MAPNEGVKKVTKRPKGPRESILDSLAQKIRDLTARMQELEKTVNTNFAARLDATNMTIWQANKRTSLLQERFDRLNETLKVIYGGIASFAGANPDPENPRSQTRLLSPPKQGFSGRPNSDTCSVSNKKADVESSAPLIGSARSTRSSVSTPYASRPGLPQQIENLLHPYRA